MRNQKSHIGISFFFFETSFFQQSNYSHLFFGFTLLSLLEFRSLENAERESKLYKSQNLHPEAFELSLVRKKVNSCELKKQFEIEQKLNKKGFKQKYLLPFLLFCNLFPGLVMAWLFGRTPGDLPLIGGYSQPIATMASGIIPKVADRLVRSENDVPAPQPTHLRSTQPSQVNAPVNIPASSSFTTQVSEVGPLNSDKLQSSETGALRDEEASKILKSLHINAGAQTQQDQLIYSRKRRFTPELKLRSVAQAWSETEFGPNLQRLKERLAVNFLDIQHQGIREGRLQDKLSESLEIYKNDSKAEKTYLVQTLKPARAAWKKATVSITVNEEEKTSLHQAYQEAKKECQRLRQVADSSFTEMKHNNRASRTAKNVFKKSTDLFFRAVRDVQKKNGISTTRSNALLKEATNIKARYAADNTNEFQVKPEEFEFIKSCAGNKNQFGRLVEKFNVVIDDAGNEMVAKTIKYAGTSASFDPDESAAIYVNEAFGRLPNPKCGGKRPFDVVAWQKVEALNLVEAECLFGWIDKMCHHALTGLNPGEEFTDFSFSRPLVDFALTYADSQAERQAGDPVDFVDLVNICLRASPDFFQNPDPLNKFPGKKFTIKLGNLAPKIPDKFLEPTVKECLSLSYPLPPHLVGVKSGEELENYYKDFQLKTTEAVNYLATATLRGEKHHIVQNESGGTHTALNGVDFSSPAHGLSHVGDDSFRIASGKACSASNVRAASSRVKHLAPLITDKQGVYEAEKQRIENQKI